jgi:hypothetical protein
MSRGFTNSSRWLTDDLEPETFERRPVTCNVCGCRLTEVRELDGLAWRHFQAMIPGQDARGCRPGCVDELHDRAGWVLAPSHLNDLLEEGAAPA